MNLPWDVWRDTLPSHSIPFPRSRSSHDTRSLGACRFIECPYDGVGETVDRGVRRDEAQERFDEAPSDDDDQRIGIV